MKLTRLSFALTLMFAWQAAWLACAAHGQSVPSQPDLINGGNLAVEAFDDGSYALRSTAITGDVLRSVVEADTAAGTLKSSLYPKHLKSIAAFDDELGSGHLLTVTHTGLPNTPDLICEFRVYDNQPWGDIRVSISNTTGGSIEVHAIRVVKSTAGAVLRLNGPDSEDRVLSDSFSEDTPQMRLMDLGEADGGVHRAFGSQLIYNRQSGQSLFLGVLSADKFLTVFHLLSSERPDAHLLSYDVADTGTNEALQDQSKDYPPDNIVPFRLQVPAGKSLSSERMIFAIGSDYHAQLENYGRAIRILYKPPVSTPTPIGWWSWTAYYRGVTQNMMLTNAAWMAQNLEPLGYRYFQIDEGYQYARGSTPL